jgi:hypothetical protein
MVRCHVKAWSQKSADNMIILKNKKMAGENFSAPLISFSLTILVLLALTIATRGTAATCYVPPAGLVGWWPGDGNGNDIIGTNNGVLQGGATATITGEVGQAFNFDGTNSFVQVPDVAVLRPTNLTIETWVRFSSLDSSGTAGSPPGDQYIVFKQNARSGDFEGFDLSKTRVAGGDVFRFLVSSVSAQLAEIHSSTLLTTGTWYHVACVRGSNFTQIYVNGQLERQTNVSFAQNYGAHPLYFGSSGQSYWDHKLKGSLDEVSIYNRALSAGEISSIYASGAAGKCKPGAGLAISSQPQSQTVAVGSNAVFNVGVNGSAPFSYQWQFNGTGIAGATFPGLIVANAQLADGGNYNVVVTNTSGSVTSAMAALTVLIPPAITLQPQGATNIAGGSAVFNAAATGSAPLSYQWRLNGTNLANGVRISGATTANLTVSPLQFSDAGAYTLAVSNAAGSVTSGVAPLIVTGPPVITAQPAGQTLVVGMNATFNVSASGTQPLNYQWRRNGTDLVDGLNIFGSTTAVLNITNVQLGDSANFQVVITNIAGSITSAVAVLTVNPAPTPPLIITPPANQTLTAGSNATFTVTAAGTAPLAYQWRKNGGNMSNGGNVSGAASSALTLTGVQSVDAANYQVVVTNIAGAITSVVASLTVNVPPSISAPPASQTVAVGSNTAFTVTVTGTGPFSYQWRFNGTNLADGGSINGSAGSNLSITGAQPTNAGAYSVVVGNVSGSVTSAVAVLTVTVPGSCSPPVTGLVGWWPGDGNAGDIAGADNGSLQGGATSAAAGLVAQAFSFDGTNSYVQIPDAPVLHPTNLTIEAWVRFASLDSPASGGSAAGDQYIVFKQNTRNGDFEGFDLSKTRVAGGDVFRFLVSSATAQLAEIHSSTLLSTGVWYHVAGVRGSNFTQIYVNGQLERQTNVAFPQDYGNLPVFFGSSGQSFWDHKLKGNLDEVSLYNRALSSNEIASIYAAGAGGKCKGLIPPTISSQPTNRTLVVGGSVTFSVKAGGSAPLNYQWTKDGSKLLNSANISGATGSALTLVNLLVTDAGNYQVVITNNAGAVTSIVATLSTGVPPANDAFASAQTISGSLGSVTGTTLNATKQTGEPNHAGNIGGSSVWYAWSAPSTSPVTFDTALSGFNTLLAVYTGTAVDTLTMVASNDDIAANNFHSRLTFTPVAGTTYKIAVDGANGSGGNVTLRWAQASAALPDLTIVGSAVAPVISTETFGPNTCAVMEGLIQAGTRTIIRFNTETENQGAADLYFGNPANNPLFVFAPCHAHYHFNNYMSYRLRDANGNVAAVGLKVGFCILDVFRWNPGSSSTAKYNCSNQGIQIGWGDVYDTTLDGQWIDITGLPAGNYTIEIEANPQGMIQESNYGNNITQVPITIGNPTAPPLNDNFASAQTLLGGFSSVAGNNLNATKQSGEPNHAGNSGGHSLWYQWTALDTKPVTIDTISSSFNTLLAVYTGSSLTALTPVASNDDIANPGQLQSRVTFPATAGTVYRIAVDGFNGATGNMVLTLNQSIQNDNFANPQFIGGVSGLAYGSDSGATKETGEPNHAGNVGGNSIWYAWTAPINGLATFDTIGSTFNTLLAAYTGNSVDSLTVVAGNDDIDPANNNFLSRVTFNAVGLSRYYIAIDGYNGDTGDSTLNWSLTSGGPAALALKPAAVNQRASLTMDFLPDGECRLAIAGQPLSRYSVEVSCDLIHWTASVPTVSDISGLAFFTDKTTVNMGSQSPSADPVCGRGQVAGVAFTPGSSRFYRAIALPPE